MRVGGKEGDKGVKGLRGEVGRGEGSLNLRLSLFVYQNLYILYRFLYTLISIYTNFCVTYPISRIS